MSLHARLASTAAAIAVVALLVFAPVSGAQYSVSKTGGTTTTVSGNPADFQQESPEPDPEDTSVETTEGEHDEEAE